MADTFTSDQFRDLMTKRQRPAAAAQPAAPKFSQSDFRSFMASRQPKSTAPAPVQAISDTVRKAKDWAFGKENKVAAVDEHGRPAMVATDPGVVGRLWDRFKAVHVAGNETIGDVLEKQGNPFGRSNLEQYFVSEDREKARQDWVKTIPQATISTPFGSVNLQDIASGTSDVGTAIRQNLEGLLSPGNLILAGGGLARGEGTAAVGAMAKAKSTLSRLMNFGFAYQMTTGAIDDAKGSLQAFMAGDMDQGIQLAVNGLVGGVMATGVITEGRARTKVIKTLEDESSKRYNKSWYSLAPEQKAHVVYEATKRTPQLAEHLGQVKSEGLAGPQQSTELEDQARSAAVDQERRELGNAAIFASIERPEPQLTEEDQAYERALAAHAGWQERKAAAEKKQGDREVLDVRDRIALNEAPPMVPPEPDGYRERKDRKVARLTVPEIRPLGERLGESRIAAVEAQPFFPEGSVRTGMTPPGTPLDLPPIPMTPLDRAGELLVDRRAESLRTLEDESALQKQEEEERSDAIEHIERRTVPDLEALQREIYQSIPQAPEIRSEAEFAYRAETDELRRSAAQLGSPGKEASPERLYERLVQRRFDGQKIAPAEDDFMRRYAHRKQTEHLLINDEARKTAADLTSQITRAQVQKIVSMAHREGKMFDVAFDLHREAMRAKTADEADFLASQSTEALTLAARLQRQREAEQSSRKASLDPEQFVARQPEVYVYEGKPTSVVMTDGTQLPASYGAVRLSRLIPSHDAYTFEWNDRYQPRKMQPRDLKTNTEAQAAIIKDSSPGNFDVRRFTTDNPTAEQGPPIILKDGRIVGGNSRLLRLKRALDTEDRQDIIRGLIQETDKFGIKFNEDFADTDDPLIPVRVLDDWPEDAAALERYGKDFNRDFIMAFTPEEQSVMDGQRLTLDDMETISRWIDALPGEGESQSLTKLLNTRGREVFDLMVQRGIIPENKRAAYLRNEELTEEGKTQFKRMILGKVIDDANVLAFSKDTTLNKVERAVVPLVRLKSATPEWNITDYLKDALKLWVDIERVRDEVEIVGKKTDTMVDRYLHPEDFKDSRGFSGAPHLIPKVDPHPITRALAKLLELSGLKVKDSLFAYADEAEQRQIRLTEPMSPVDAFNQFIGEKVDVEVSPLDWGTLTAATEIEKEHFAEAKKNPPKPTEEQRERMANPLEMNPVPAMERAYGRLQAAAVDGTVTPESLREFFDSDPRFRGWSAPLMRIFGEVIPRATEQDLASFLKTAIADVRYGGEPVEGMPQGAKGAMSFAEDGRRVIHLFDNADISTITHEMFHVIRPYLNKADLETLETYAHVELRKQGIDVAPGEWSREKEETLARAWERYLASGKSPVPQLKEIFGRLRDAFRKIYYLVTGGKEKLPEDSPLKVRMTREVRDTFDKWFGKKPEREEAIEAPPTALEMKAPPTEETRVWADEMEQAIAAGDFTADLIPWKPDEDPARSIGAMRAELEKRGWKWNEKARQLEKGNAYVWFRSQGKFAGPIAQWHQLAEEPKEIAEPPLTPEQMENLQPAFYGPKHYYEVEGTPRVKRTANLPELRAWAILNKDKIKGLTAWITPEEGAVAMYVPEKPEVLFQVGPSLNELREMETRAGDLRAKLISPFLSREERSRMERELADLNTKLQGQHDLQSRFGGAILGMTPPPAEGTMEPPPTAKKTPQFELLFGEESRAEETNQRRAGVDDRAQLQDRGRNDRLAERTGRPDRGAGERGRLSGRRPGQPRTAGAGQESFRDARPVDLALATRPLAAPAVDENQWRYRIAEMRMPGNTPVPTHLVDDDVSAVLIGAQPDVVNVAYSSLQQFDGAIIATPTGTGKTFMGMAIAKQFWKEGKRRQLVLTKNRDIIEQRDGWEDVAKKYYGLQMEPIAESRSKMKPEGLYVTTYNQLIRNPWLAEMSWDLVTFDESAEARRWYDSQQGAAARRVSDVAQKAVYISATPFHTALEYGYMTKLGLWGAHDRTVPDFERWARQFGAVKNKQTGNWVRHGMGTHALTALRNQLIGRGQFVTMAKDYKGYTSHFAQVPLTQQNRADLVNGKRAFLEAESYFKLQGNMKLAKAARRVAVIWTKNYLERARLPQAVDIMLEARRRGWQVVLFAENSKERREVYDFMKSADKAMEGRLSQMLPRYEGVYDKLARELGERNVANFSGSKSAERTEQLRQFLDAEKPYMFATYGAGGVGVSLHDTSDNGVHPRMAIYLGPPYSGIMFEQAQGRLWRYGSNSNVHNIFLASNAMPEIDMLVGKIAPRLDSLKAAVEGIDGTDPLVQRMRDMAFTHRTAASFMSTRVATYDVNDFTPLDEQLPLSNWMEALKAIPDAEQAKGKGMDYPGRKKKTGGFERLLQEGHELNVPQRFLSPEEAKARLLNTEMMDALREGEPLPGVGEDLSDIDRGTRTILANGAEATVASKINQRSEADPVAVARLSAKTGFTTILAAKRAGEVDALTSGGEGTPGWQMNLPGGAEVEEPEDRRIRAHAFLLSGEQNIQSMARQAGAPEVGDQIVRSVRQYMAARSEYAGEQISRYKKILADNRITREEHRTLWLVKEGKIPAPNERFKRAAGQITDQLNDIRRMAGERDLYVQDFDDNGNRKMIPYADVADKPNYMPHIHDFNEKISLIDPVSNEKQVFTLRELLGGTMNDIKRERVMSAIERKTGMSRWEVEKFLKNRRRRTPLAGNMERARKAELPFYRMDEGAMYKYFENMGELFARAEQFGQDRSKLSAMIAKIPNSKARTNIDTLMNSLLERRPWDEEVGKMYSRLMAAEVLSKMTFSPIKIPFHGIHLGLLLDGYKPVLSALFDTALNYKEMKERALFSGAVVDQMIAQSVLDYGTDLNLAHNFLQVSGFNWIYTLDRIVANTTAAHWMERYALPALMKKAKSAEHVRDQLKNIMLIDDAQIDRAIAAGRWTQDDLKHGGVALANRAMFTSNPLEMAPMMRAQGTDFLSNNIFVALRLASALKSFTFKTAMLMKSQLIDEARRGNYRPWVPFMLAYPVAGQAMHLVATAATSGVQRIGETVTGSPRQESSFEREVAKLEDLFENPTFAKVADEWITGAAHATGMTMLSHIHDVLFGAGEGRKKRFQQKQLLADLEEELAGPVYSDLLHTLQSLINITGEATSDDDAEAKYEKIRKEGLKWARKTAPALRAVLPSPSAPTNQYQMAPAP